MDRDAIERHDFPVGRRGYDPGAVDAHLRAVADELDSLRARAAEPAHRGLSAGTSEQVRLILEAAERSAAQLTDQAGRDASEHVERVQGATSEMLSKLDQLQSDLDAMLAALKRSGERLEQGLEQLRRDVGTATPDAPAPEPAPQPVAELEAPGPEATAPEPQAPEPPAPEPPEPEPVPEPPVVAVANGTSDADETGARLTAFSMALAGTPREETAAYLAEHYTLADASALLDDVYKRAGS